MRKGALSDINMKMKYPELKTPPIHVAHNLHTKIFDKTIFHGVKPARGASHIKTMGTGKFEMNNLNLITALDYQGGLDAYNRELKAKKQHKPITNKRIPNCSNRIERMLTTISNGDETTFNNLVDLLQFNTGLSKLKYHHCDDDILEALNRHYRKNPDQLTIIEMAYKDA
jgi:hypothetical protein